MDDDIVPYIEGFASDARVQRLISDVRDRSPRSLMGDDLLHDLALELEEWRKDESLPSVTPARLALRLRYVANIGRDLITGWIKERYSEELRDPKRRTTAIRKLNGAREHLRKAADIFEHDSVRAYAGERLIDLEPLIGRLELKLTELCNERGRKGLTESLRLPVGVLGEIGRELCGRSLRNVGRIEGIESGPFFRFAFEVLRCLIPEVPEAELSSSIRTLMREPKS